MRRIVLLAPCLLGFLVGPALGQDKQPFCQRLAPELGLRQSAEGVNTVWRVNQAGGLGRALFGGPAVMTSIGLDPVDEDSLTEYKRLKDACRQTEGGAVCNVVGPAKLHLRTKIHDATSVIQPGEHVEVEVARATIICRDIGHQ